MSKTNGTALHARRLNELYRLRQRIDEEIRALHEMQQSVSRRRRKRRSEAVCGTDGGYHRHRRILKEPACEACKMAHRIAEAERVHKHRRAENEKAKSREAS